MHAKHLDQLTERCPALASCLGDIEKAFFVMRDAYRAQHKMLLCGNGGSAADADHWAGELLKGFRKKRPLPHASRANLPDTLAEHLQGALPAIPLTGMSALSTAFANDVLPEFVLRPTRLGPWLFR